VLVTVDAGEPSITTRGLEIGDGGRADATSMLRAAGRHLNRSGFSGASINPGGST